MHEGMDRVEWRRWRNGQFNSMARQLVSFVEEHQAMTEANNDGASDISKDRKTQLLMVAHRLEQLTADFYKIIKSRDYPRQTDRALCLFVEVFAHCGVNLDRVIFAREEHEEVELRKEAQIIDESRDEDEAMALMNGSERATVIEGDFQKTTAWLEDFLPRLLALDLDLDIACGNTDHKDGQTSLTVATVMTTMHRLHRMHKDFAHSQRVIILLNLWLELFLFKSLSPNGGLPRSVANRIATLRQQLLQHDRQKLCGMAFNGIPEIGGKSNRLHALNLLDQIAVKMVLNGIPVAPENITSYVFKTSDPDPADLWRRINSTTGDVRDQVITPKTLNFIVARCMTLKDGNTLDAIYRHLCENPHLFDIFLLSKLIDAMRATFGVERVLDLWNNLDKMESLSERKRDKLKSHGHVLCSVLYAAFQGRKNQWWISLVESVLREWKQGKQRGSTLPFPTPFFGTDSRRDNFISVSEKIVDCLRRWGNKYGNQNYIDMADQWQRFTYELLETYSHARKQK